MLKAFFLSSFFYFNDFFFLTHQLNHAKHIPSHILRQILLLTPLNKIPFPTLSSSSSNSLLPTPFHFLGSQTDCDFISDMKFGKRLKQQIQEALPGWRDKFLSYKELKKVVVRFHEQGGKSHHDETEFVYLLNNEIDKFNWFFIEQEEDFIIRHKELQNRIQKVIDRWGPNGTHPPSDQDHYKEEMGKIRKDIVDLHGEMVLLENYSNVNYTGLAKILKKYDKRTGGLLRPPFIQKVLEQPFFTTDLISKLVKECENTIDRVFPVDDEDDRTKRRKLGVGTEPIRVGHEEGIFRNTVAALLSMQEIRSASSTYSHFSLPPLNLPDSELIHSLQLNSPIPIL